MSSSSSLKQEDDTISSPELPPLAAPGIAAAAAAAAAAASSGGAGGVGIGGAIGSGRRLPPPCWTHEETLALIEAYRDKWEALKKGNLRAADWDEVAGAVTARCGRFPTATYKSGVQCRHKIEKLRKRYRAERSRSAGRSKGPKWPFFALLHDLAGGGAPDPSPNPIIKIKPRTSATPASPSSPSPASSDGDAGRSRSLHGLISNGGGGSGLRFTIPKGSRTRPGMMIPRGEPNPRPDTNNNGLWMSPFPRGSAAFPWPKKPRAELARVNLPDRLAADDGSEPGPSASFPRASIPRLEGWGSHSARLALAIGEVVLLPPAALAFLRRRPTEISDRSSPPPLRLYLSCISPLPSPRSAPAATSPAWPAVADGDPCSMAGRRGLPPSL